jgi:hypothetical protein
MVLNILSYHVHIPSIMLMRHAKSTNETKNTRGPLKHQASVGHNECSKKKNITSLFTSVTNDIESLSIQSKERLRPPDEEITRSNGENAQLSYSKPDMS